MSPSEDTRADDARQCAVCGNPVLGGPKKQFCGRGCYNEHRRHKRAADGAVILGTEMACRECGAAFTKEHKRQFYCPTCNAMSARDYLPSQRARVIA